MNTKKNDTISIEFLKKDHELQSDFQFPKCARCTNACKRCKLTYLMDISAK